MSGNPLGFASVAELAAEFAEEIAEGLAPELAAAAILLFLAVGGATEDAMQVDVWEQAGLCEPLKATGRPCDYEDGTEECQKARARNRPCVFSMDNFIRILKRSDDWDAAPPARPVRRTERRTWHCVPSWIPNYQKCTTTTEVVEEEAADEMPYPYPGLLRPEWVPADQPTEHRGIGGQWMKLQLRVAESELSRPSRVRARPAPAATAWGPERILAAIEGQVRTLAAGLFSRLPIVSTLSTR